LYYLYRKICENLDVDLEATACVHSLQYSTVQYRTSRDAYNGHYSLAKWKKCQSIDQFAK